MSQRINITSKEIEGSKSSARESNTLHRPSLRKGVGIGESVSWRKVIMYTACVRGYKEMRTCAHMDWSVVSTQGQMGTVDLLQATKGIRR